MARIINFVIPRMGEPFDSARLVSWSVAPGQAFKRGDVLLEIETDKSTIEIPAPDDGKVIEQLVKLDGSFDSSTPVARLELNSQPPAAEPSAALSSTEPGPALAGTGSSSDSGALKSNIPGRSGSVENGLNRSRIAATPVAKNSARERGLPLEQIHGTGPDGRITLADVLRTAAKQQYKGVAPPARQGSAAGTRSELTVATSYGGIHIGRWEPAAPRQAPTVVLIHGIFGNIDTWSSVASNLVRAGFAVIAADLPCHGKSTSAVTEFSDIVDALAQAISTVCPDPMVLVGHSLGGALSARLAHEPALNIHALVLIASAGLGTEIQQEFLYGMLYGATNEALIRELNKLTVTGVSLSAAYLDELRAGLERRTDVLKVLCDGISRNGVQQINIIPDLQQLAAPVTAIHGRSDGIIPWRHALNVPARVALHLAPAAGHMPQWDAAQLVSDVIARQAT